MPVVEDPLDWGSAPPYGWGGGSSSGGGGLPTGGGSTSFFGSMMGQMTPQQALYYRRLRGASSQTGTSNSQPALQQGISQFLGGMGNLGNASGFLPSSTPASAPGFSAGGSSQWNPYAYDPRHDINGAMNRMFGQAGLAGVYSPYGSPALLDAIRQQMQAGAGQQERTARNYAYLNAGGDPSLAAYGGLMAGLGAQSSLSNALSNAQLQSIMQNQNFLQSLGGTAQNYSGQQYLAEQMKRMYPNGMYGNQGTFWGSLGQGLGTGLGSLGGAALGKLF